MSEKLKQAQPKPNPQQVEILKGQFMRLAVMVNDNEVLIRLLQELEGCLVEAIGPNGERDYSRHAVVLQKMNLPWSDPKSKPVGDVAELADAISRKICPICKSGDGVLEDSGMHRDCEEL